MQQSETVKLNVTKSYILADVVGILALVLLAFYRLFILTMNSINSNYYISVTSLKQLISNIKQTLTGTVK